MKRRNNYIWLELKIVSKIMNDYKLIISKTCMIWINF